MTTPVDESGRRVLGVLDEFIANMTKVRDDLAAILDQLDPPRPLPVPESTEQQVTADEMEPGGWVRLPSSPRWRRVARVVACATWSASSASRSDPIEAGCRRIDFDTYPLDRDGTFVHVNADEPYEYQSAADFDADCDREQRNAAAERIDLAQQRARDFGHDNEAA